MKRRLKTEAHDDGVNAWRFVRSGPAPELAAQVFGYGDYWERTAGFTRRRELPHAEGVLIVNLGEPIQVVGGDGRALRLDAGEAFAAGPHLNAAFSVSSGEQAGMHVFLPLATLRRLLGAPMTTLMDQVVPLDVFLGRRARDLGEALGEAPDAESRFARLEAALQEALSASSPLCPGQARALARLRARPDLDISEIARELGWSRKHLADRVKDAVGVGPRSFRRLLRFQGLIARTREVSGEWDWTTLAHEAGYFDQSHMIREFREFAGLTPSAYRAQMLPDGGGLMEA